MSVDTSSSRSRAEALFEHYRGLVFSLLAIVILGIFAWGLTHWQEEKGHNHRADSAYRFKQGPLASLRENPEEVAGFLEAFRSLARDEQGIHRVLLGLEAANFLKSEGKHAEALAVLETIYLEGGDSLGQYLVALNMAALAEEMAQPSRALEILEALAARDELLWEEYVYLNLGRLYLEGGEREKARTHFLYIEEKAKEDEVDGDILKTARLFLERMDGE